MHLTFRVITIAYAEGEIKNFYEGGETSQQTPT